MAKTPARDDTLDGEGVRLGLARSVYQRDLMDAMREHALRRVRTLGATVVHEVDVSGSYDLPLAVQALLRRPDVDAVVALGAIVQGETRHDEAIGYACARALTQLSLEFDKPVGLGVTGPGQTLEQAHARVDRAGAAVDSVVRLLRSLGRLGPASARRSRVATRPPSG